MNKSVKCFLMISPAPAVNHGLMAVDLKAFVTTLWTRAYLRLLLQQKANAIEKKLNKGHLTCFKCTDTYSSIDKLSS